MILFRADGNKKIGTGHVMRCLSIAEAFRDIRTECVFVSADDTVKELIEKRGFRLEILGTDPERLCDEIEILAKKKYFISADCIIVDSYFADDKYLRSLSGQKTAFYIDDYIEKRPVDCIINYNIYAGEKEYEGIEGPDNQRLLVGAKYAPLRKEFRDAGPKEIKDRARNVLFLAGGSDPAHAAINFATEISGRSDDLKYTIVMGSMAEDFDAANRIAEESKGRIRVLKNVSEMAALMQESDIAVSAAGSTLYELCACLVPTVNYILADNQRLGAKGFENKNAMICAGDLREDELVYEKLYQRIIDLSGNREKRRILSENAGRLVDGKGAERLAREIVKIIKEQNKRL